MGVWSGNSWTYCLQGSHLIVREVPMPTYEERVRLLAHHRLSELGTLGPRRRPCNCTTHTKLHSMSSWRTTLCTWSAVVEFREAPLAPGAARRASRVMDVLLLLLLLTTLAHGQCTEDKDIIHITITSVKDIFIISISPLPPLLLLTTLAHGQCTVDKDIHSYYNHFGQLKQRHS